MVAMKTIDLPPPHAPRRSHIMFHPPPLKALVFFLLLHLFLLFYGHLRPRHNNIFFIFFVVYFIAPNDDNTPPPRVPPRYRTLPNIPLHRERHLLVGCCLKIKSRSHLRPGHRLSFFFDGPSFCAQSSPHSVNKNKSRVPDVSHSVISLRVAPGWAADSDGRR